MSRDLFWKGRFGRPATPAEPSRRAAARSAEALTAWMCVWISAKLRLPADQVTPDSAFEDLGLDSLVAVELSGQLEELLGREVPASVAWDHRTLRDLGGALFAPAAAAYGDMDRASA